MRIFTPFPVLLECRSLSVSVCVCVSVCLSKYTLQELVLSVTLSYGVELSSLDLVAGAFPH